MVKVAYNNIFAQYPGGALTDTAGNAVELFDFQAVTNASVDDSALNFGAQPVLSQSTITICEGDSGTYGISLPSQPTGGSLEIGIFSGPHDVVYAGPEYLSFNQENWDKDQTITVLTGVVDDDYTNWGKVKHRIDGVALYHTTDTVMRVLVQEGSLADCNTPATGTPQVGQTLTASTSDIADVDGLTNVAYSYQRCGDVHRRHGQRRVADQRGNGGGSNGWDVMNDAKRRSLRRTVITLVAALAMQCDRQLAMSWVGTDAHWEYGIKDLPAAMVNRNIKLV